MDSASRCQFSVVSPSRSRLPRGGRLGVVVRGSGGGLRLIGVIVARPDSQGQRASQRATFHAAGVCRRIAAVQTSLWHLCEGRRTQVKLRPKHSSRTEEDAGRDRRQNQRVNFYNKVKVVPHKHATHVVEHLCAKACAMCRLQPAHSTRLARTSP